MSRIRLGGIKISEGRSHLNASCHCGENALTNICSRLAANRINITLLTHVADSGGGHSVSALCTEKEDGFSGYFLLKVKGGQDCTVSMQSDINILSVFPHEQKPAVTGKLLETLAGNGVRLRGLASSPSAMSLLIASPDMARVIDGLFSAFDFPSYPTPLDWHAAYQGKEQVLREIICSYEEQVIKVYNIAQQVDLDLWSLTLPHLQLNSLGAALVGVDGFGIRMPFMVAHPRLQEQLSTSFCFPISHREEVRQELSRHLPQVFPVRHDPVVALSLHGPHFGDRYGITNALVGALQGAAVLPLAVSCAVSTISVVIRSEELERSIQALSGNFTIPS
jgi:aspartokinase